MKIKLLLLALSSSTIVAVAGIGNTLTPVAAYNPLGQACQTAAGNATPKNGQPSPQNAAQNSTCTDANKQNSSDNPAVRVLGDAARILSLIVGFAAIILIIVSGINLITSAGNTEAVGGAKKRLVAAIIGLAIASLAWVLSSYIINQLL